MRLQDVWRTCNKIRAAIFRVGFNLWNFYKPLDPNNNCLISGTVTQFPLLYQLKIFIFFVLNTFSRVFQLFRSFRIIKLKFYFTRYRILIFSRHLVFTNILFHEDCKWRSWIIQYIFLIRRVEIYFGIGWAAEGSNWFIWQRNFRFGRLFPRSGWSNILHPVLWNNSR